MSYSALRPRLKLVLEELSIDISTQDRKNAVDLFDAGEYGEALDVFCTQLYEDDVAISEVFRRELIAIAGIMGVPESKYKFLNELVRSPNAPC